MGTLGGDIIGECELITDSPQFPLYIRFRVQLKFFINSDFKIMLQNKIS